MRGTETPTVPSSLASSSQLPALSLAQSPAPAHKRQETQARPGRASRSRFAHNHKRNEPTRRIVIYFWETTVFTSTHPTKQ